MLLDLIFAILLTAAAAILVAALAWRFPGDGSARLKVATALGAWFAVIVTFGATGALDATSGLGAPGLGVLVLLPVLSLSYAASRPELLEAARLALPVPLLVAVNALRVLGIGFVLLYAADRLPAPFAPAAGWGDFAIGATALPVAALAARRARGWRTATLLWNSLGLLDLVVAVSLGVMSATGSPVRIFFGAPGTDIMSGLPWILIPAFLVPLLILTHLAVFARLLVHGQSSPRSMALA